MKTLLLVCAVLASTLTATAYTNYYVSNAGSDSNNGTSPSTPWATVAKVNGYGSFVAGDIISFQCGGIWREELVPQSGNSMTQAKLTYNSYGEGNKPRFLGSVSANSGGLWTETTPGSHIWYAGGNTGGNLLTNPSFATNLSGWTLTLADPPANAAATVVRNTSVYDSSPASAAISVTNVGAHNSEIRFTSNSFSLTSGKTYRLKFWAKGTSAFTMVQPYLVESSNVNVPYFSNYTSWDGNITTTAWTYHQIDYTANVTASDAMLYFRLGASVPASSTCYLDDVSVEEVNSIFPIDIGSVSFNNPSYIDNPFFTADDSGWSLYVNSANGVVAAKSRDASNYESGHGPACEAIAVINHGSAASDIQLYRNNLSLTTGTTYRLEFRARCTSAFTMDRPGIIEEVSPWNAYYAGTPAWTGPTGNGSITTTWATYMIDFTTNTTANDARVDFFLGAIPNGATLYIDDITLTERTDNPSMIANPSFVTNATGWTFGTGGAASATNSRDTLVYDSIPASNKTHVATKTTTQSDIQLSTGNLSITSGKVYRLSFRAKASSPCNMIQPTLIKQVSPYTVYYSSATGFATAVTTDWSTFTVDFTANTTATDAEVMFWLSNSIPNGTDFYLDDVNLKEVFVHPSVDTSTQNDYMGSRKLNQGDLAVGGDFWYDQPNSILYMYSPSNPGSLYATVECAQTVEMCDITGTGSGAHKNYIVVDGLAFWNCAGDGVRVSYGDHVSVTNCDVRFIGGGYTLGWGSTVRFGNAFQLWLDANDVTLTNNYIINVYDAGISNQGTSLNSEYNLYYRYNTLIACQYGLELWDRPSTSTMHDVYYEHNTSLAAGTSFSYTQRPDPARASHILLSQTFATPCTNISIQYNDCEQSTQVIVWAYNPLTDIDNLSAWVLDHNTYKQASGNFAAWGPNSYAANATDFGNYKTYSGKDTNSVLNPP